MKLSRLITAFIIPLLLLSACKSHDGEYQLIPAPAYQKQTGNYITFENGVEVVSGDKRLNNVLDLLSAELTRFNSGKAENKARIHFKLNEKYQADDESYRLEISKKDVYITANSEKGILYGAVSLLQLANVDKQIPTGEIIDEPRFSYRGFMLDESRHFFGTEKVKQLLDVMMYLKLNTFAWHLTDEPGWRLEIKAYPGLTSEGGKGNYSDAAAPAQFYTQEEIKEIVAYAAKRGITVIPEIDMPGHATAANKAYPEFSGGGSEKHPDFTFNPGKEATYTYLTNILREVTDLFPSSIIHFGGDEVHFGNEEWNSIDDVQRLMKNERLANLKEVERYFSRRMGDSIQSLGKVVGAWDEAIDCELDPSNTIIYWWRHDKPQQLQRSLDGGYSTVLCPRRPLYFDFVQDSTDAVGRRWNGFNPYEDVYYFPDSLEMFQNYQGDLIEGIQANLWTETVQSTDRFDYLIYTRLTAMAEAAWTNAEIKSLDSFNQRLKKVFVYFDKQDIYYYDPFSQEEKSEPLK